MIIIGDSAGAYVLSKYYFSNNVKDDVSKEYFLVDGLNPKSNLFTVAHVDNEYHTPIQKMDKAKRVSKEIGVELLLLKENESVLYENGVRKDFIIDELLV